MIQFTRRHLMLVLAATAGSAALPALAQTYTVTLPPKDQARVKLAADYLQALKMAKGRFLQTNDRGAQAAGTLYLSRPGRARFEYDEAAGLLVVADGRNVGVFDKKLKTFDRYPLGATPLGIFLSRRIQLNNEVMVTRVQTDEDGFALTVKDANKQADGSLTLSFKADPIQLRGWTVTEDNGAQTTVVLQDLEPADGFDPALFVITDPKPPKPDAKANTTEAKP